MLIITAVITCSYRITCAWDENASGSKTGDKSEVAEPQLLPVVSEGSPNKVTYTYVVICIERKNAKKM
jgi:hypothetical protein